MPRLLHHFLDPQAQFGSTVTGDAVVITGATPENVSAYAHVVDSTTAVNLAITINGTDYADYCGPNTLNVSLELNGNDTCSFELRDVTKSASNRIVVGSTLEITNNGVVLFAGSVDKVQEAWELAEDKKVLRQKVTGISHKRALDRIWVSMDYINNPSIVSAIVGSLMVANNISVLDVGGVLYDVPFHTYTDQYRFDWMPLSQAFDRIAASINTMWYMDENKVVHFVDFSQHVIAAPYSLSDTSPYLSGLRVDRSLDNYANEVYVRTNFSLATNYSKTFTADGSTTEFFLDFTPSRVISITENGVTKTVGLINDPVGGDGYLQGSTGYDWYYQPDEANQVQTLPPRSPIPSGVTIVVNYDGPASNIAVARDTAEQAARAAVEGNSGVYMAVLEEKSFVDEAAAQQYANAMLARMSTPQTVLNMTSYYNGWRPGQTVDVDFADAGIGDADTFLIDRVQIRSRDFQQGAPKRLVYTIEATSSREPLPRTGLQLIERIIEIARQGPDPKTEATEGQGDAGGATAFEAVFNYDAFDVNGNHTLAVGADVTVHRALRLDGDSVKLTEVHALVDVAPTGAGVKLNVRYFDADGVDQGYILAADLEILAGTTSATEITDFAVEYLDHGGHLELDVTQVGSTTTGTKLAVYVRGTVQ